MTITNIKQLIEVVLTATKSGNFPDMIINGETYRIRIKGVPLDNGYIVKGHEKGGEK